MIFMSFVWRSIVLLSVLCVASGAQALSEMNAKIRDNLLLRSAPDEDSETNGVDVVTDETVFVLGTSVDGSWVKVLKKNGQSGWLTLNYVDLYRVDREEYDDFYYELMRERRYTTRWAWNMGLSYGPAPMGVGVESLLHINLAKRGLLDSNVDQFELASGIRYHLGSDPRPALRLDGSLYNKPARAFYEVPVFLVWLFRMGYRGQVMLGPRIGFSIIKDFYNRFEYSLPGLTGFEFRYYPADRTGLISSTWIQVRSVIYYQTSTGLSFRF
jgi:hypothetical protein